MKKLFYSIWGFQAETRVARRNVGCTQSRKAWRTQSRKRNCLATEQRRKIVRFSVASWRAIFLLSLCIRQALRLCVQQKKPSRMRVF